MENRNLFTFKKVCELNSITKASVQLGYAQSTVTTQIKLLESELGVKLFERYGNALHITPAGEKLLEYSNEIFRVTERFFDAMGKESEAYGCLRIAAVDSICMSILPNLLKRFMQTHPKANVKIITGVADELKHLLSIGQADIALILDLRDPCDDFCLLLEKKVELGFYIGTDAQMNTVEIGLEDLKKQKFALTEPNCQYRKRVERLFEDNGIAPEIFMESSSTEAIIKIVESGHGITYLPDIVADKNPGLQRLHLINEHPVEKFSLQMLMHKNKWKSTVISEFIKSVIDFISIEVEA